MKMTVAPCGMNCELCHSFQDKKKNCSGCRNRQTNCIIWNCNQRKEFCFECINFPCKRLKALDLRYRAKYSMSMLDNLTYIKEHGETAFLKKQKEKYTCPDCGKFRTVHYNYCIHCKQERQKGKEQSFLSPSSERLKALIGTELYQVWEKLCYLIESKYDMERLWNSGGKTWRYEYKYRRGGKTLCTLYAKENVFGFMIIFGKEERIKFEAGRDLFSSEVQTIYDEAMTYHDGKWVMFELKDTHWFDDMQRLLFIKRRPNKKDL